VNVYEFSWKPMYQSTDDRHYVQTTDKQMMDTFLLQHGFDPATANVIVTNDSQYSDDDSITLHVYTMGSQKQDRLYHIITTQEIMTVIISNIAYELLETMSFGACALKCDIELFDRIEHLIHELDYVYIRETSPSSNANPEDYDNEYYRMRYPNYPIYPSHEEISRDDEEDSLDEFLMVDTKPSNTNAVPFTVEGYIEIFTRECLLGKAVKKYGKEGIGNQ
jgi:hypothetical protein